MTNENSFISYSDASTSQQQKDDEQDQEIMDLTDVVDDISGKLYFSISIEYRINSMTLLVYLFIFISIITTFESLGPEFLISFMLCNVLLDPV